MTYGDADIRALVEAMRANGVTRLVVERKGTELRLDLGAFEPPAEPGPASPPAPRGIEVGSPGIGSFRPRGGADGLAPLAIGARVGIGEVLGYVAVGPILLAIAAPKAGCVSAPIPGPGETLGFGDPIFTIEEKP